MYLEVTCSSFSPEEYRVASFPGDDSRNGFRIQHSSWFNSGYMFGISLRGFFGRILRFPSCREDFRILRSILVLLIANCGVSAVAVHRCRRHPCHCATGRFPWSLSFSSCSTLIKWSTFVAQVQQVRVLAASYSRAPTVAARILDLVVHTPVVCNDSRPWSISSCSSSTLVDVAVVPQRPVPAVVLDSLDVG